MTDKRRVKRHNDLSGKAFNRWTAIKEVEKEKNDKHARYLCRCLCGKERVLSAIYLRSGHSKSCGCLRIEVVSKKPYETQYNRLVSHSKVPVNMSYNDYLTLINHNCHYCGDLIRWEKKGAYNLDRKDNSKGYSIENCVPCCGSCNRTKGDRFNYEEFKKIGWTISLIRSLRTKEITTESSGHIRTFTGKYYEFLNPKEEELDIIDIAHALAYQCRFVGMTSKFYSVAEHCVRVSYLCPPEYKLWGLMHDAGEAYCADISRPFKRMPGMNIYHFYEQLAINAICRRFNLDPKEPREVKEADMKMLVTEQRDLMNNAVPDFSISPVPEPIEPWILPEEAERKFLMRFHELTS